MKYKAEAIAKNLQDIGKEVLEAIDLGKNPSLEILVRSLDNVYYDEKTGLIKLGSSTQRRYYFNIAQAKKFLQTLLVAKQIKWLLDEDKPPLDIRQLFYMLKHEIKGTGENTFETQEESDPIIEDIEVLTNSLREQLRLIATPKGVIAGPLVVEDKTGDVLDFSKMGSAGGAIPPIVEREFFNIKECSADYVLVVEKYAVWNLLNQLKYWKKHNCLLLTGKGQPARAERRLLKRFESEFKLPIYIFTDMDPWGYYIYSVYKQGSITLAYFSEKAACPTAKFLGLTTSDRVEYDFPPSSLIKLDDEDYARIEELSNYKWFSSKEWQKELNDLKTGGYKIEQDALVAKSIEFTANVYLPNKIEQKRFLP